VGTTGSTTFTYRAYTQLRGYRNSTYFTIPVVVTTDIAGVVFDDV
jgi:hypothetical protein